MGTSSSRGRPRSEQADTAIMVAAIELAGEVGLGRLSMDEVAARAGVSKATIYRRWPSREAMMLDALNRSITPFDEVDTGTLAGDLHAYVGQLMERFRDGKMRNVIPHLIGAAQQDAALDKALADYVRNRHQPLFTILTRAVERGELNREIDVATVADLIIGPLMYRRLLHDEPLDERFGQTVVTMVLAGVRADGVATFADQAH